MEDLWCSQTFMQNWIELIMFTVKALYTLEVMFDYSTPCIAIDKCWLKNGRPLVLQKVLYTEFNSVHHVYCECTVYPWGYLMAHEKWKMKKRNLNERKLLESNMEVNIYFISLCLQIFIIDWHSIKSKNLIWYSQLKTDK